MVRAPALVDQALEAEKKRREHLDYALVEYERHELTFWSTKIVRRRFATAIAWSAKVNAEFGWRDQRAPADTCRDGVGRKDQWAEGSS